METEREPSSSGRSSLSPLALLGILAFGFILVQKMSKKWKKPGATQGRPKEDPKPANECRFDPATFHALRMNNATEDKKWKAVQKVIWRKQISKATCLNILTGITAAVAFCYGLVNYGMFKAMTHANKLAQESFEVSQQASVTLGRKDGVVAEFRNAQGKSQDVLVIYFQNSGHVSAKLKWGVNEWFTDNPTVVLPGATKFSPMMRTRNKKTGDITETQSSDGSIGGDAVREVAVGYLPPGFVDDLSKTNKAFMVNGTFEYCDELGRYACRDFSLAYQQRPFGSFRIMRDQICVARSYLGNTNPGPDEEVLPMCVPRNTPPFPNH